MSATAFQKTVLRLWISAASLISFVLGWAVLAQTPPPSRTHRRGLVGVQQQPGAIVRARADARSGHFAAWQRAIRSGPSFVPSMPQRGLVFSTGGS